MFQDFENNFRSYFIGQTFIIYTQKLVNKKQIVNFFNDIINLLVAKYGLCNNVKVFNVINLLLKVLFDVKVLDLF